MTIGWFRWLGSLRWFGWKVDEGGWMREIRGIEKIEDQKMRS